jgi:hypothetical protein
MAFNPKRAFEILKKGHGETTPKIGQCNDHVISSRPNMQSFFLYGVATTRYRRQGQLFVSMAQILLGIIEANPSAQRHHRLANCRTRTIGPKNGIGFDRQRFLLGLVKKSAGCCWRNQYPRICGKNARKGWDRSPPCLAKQC